MDQAGSAGQLAGMPEPFRPWRSQHEGQVLVGFGAHLIYRFDERDVGMRNLAVVGLTEAGVKGKEVAELFGLTTVHVSRLRRRALDGGSGALLPPRGAPRKLSEASERRALKLAEVGTAGAEIARRMGVSEATISRLLSRRRDARAQTAAQGELELDDREGLAVPGDGGAGDAADGESEAGGEARAPVVPAESVEANAGAAESLLATPVCQEGPLARLSEVEVQSRYAGAMLLHPFLERLGAGDVLSTLPLSAARRYDAPALVLAASFGFALGSGSLEQVKHIHLKDAGALLGLEAFPSLRTLRPRLAALAEDSDPLAVQRSFATAMLAADEHPPELFYVDDHFVTYWGGRPVAKGYNIRRHLAEPGRDDTFVVDDRWRAICFDSAEPKGLSVSLPPALSQLKEITGERPVMIGFDRGGSFPKVFNQIADAGMEWVTWRRAPLVPAGVEPKRSWVQVNGGRRSYLLADEEIELKDYEHGPVRQLTSYERGRPVFQILSSHLTLRGAPLVQKLRGRWCIENTNKYLEEHQQIHWLCTYEMDLEANTAKVKNPARTAANATVKAAESALAEAERALGQAAHAQGTELDALAAHLTEAQQALAQARTERKAVPAKLPANELSKNALRAVPRLARRALQMACRLLAYNAELDLARRLDSYLGDPDEYRTIARHLLHLGGTICYERRAISVTLDQPHPPRVTRALGELIAELNADPPRLAGDTRPIIYRLRS